MSDQSSKAAFSIPSILSVVAAIFSFRAEAVMGFFLAGIAIILGLVGILLALSPSKRGGIFSLFGVGAGVIGVIAAIIKGINALMNM